MLNKLSIGINRSTTVILKVMKIPEEIKGNLIEILRFIDVHQPIGVDFPKFHPQQILALKQTMNVTFRLRQELWGIDCFKNGLVVLSGPRNR